MTTTDTVSLCCHVGGVGLKLISARFSQTGSVDVLTMSSTFPATGSRLLRSSLPSSSTTVLLRLLSLVYVLSPSLSPRPLADEFFPSQIPDELTGQAVVAYVTMKPDFQYDDSDESGLLKELVLQVRKTIGPFAAPKRVVLVGDLPKTRSGKVRFPPLALVVAVADPLLLEQIMRRILRKISAGEGDQLGDLSTLADPSIVESIVRSLLPSSLPAQGADLARSLQKTKWGSAGAK